MLFLTHQRWIQSPSGPPADHDHSRADRWGTPWIPGGSLAEVVMIIRYIWLYGYIWFIYGYIWSYIVLYGSIWLWLYMVIHILYMVILHILYMVYDSATYGYTHIVYGSIHILHLMVEPQSVSVQLVNISSISLWLMRLIYQHASMVYNPTYNCGGTTLYICIYGHIHIA